MYHFLASKYQGGVSKGQVVISKDYFLASKYQGKASNCQVFIAAYHFLASKYYFLISNGMPAVSNDVLKTKQASNRKPVYLTKIKKYYAVGAAGGVAAFFIWFNSFDTLL